MASLSGYDDSALALLELYGLTSRGGSVKDKALGAAGTASLAGRGATELGYAPAGLSDITGGLGTAAGLAGAGYGVHQILTADDLSNEQKVGKSGHVAADVAMSLAVPYYGLAKGVNTIGRVLGNSGSPQVSAAGKTIDYATEPAGAKGFWSVVEGDASPKAAYKQMGGPRGFVLDAMGPLGAVARGVGFDDKLAGGVMDYGPVPFGGKAMKMFGIGKPPTHGTMFRDELGTIFDKMGIKGVDYSKYNVADPSKYTPEQMRYADRLGRLAASYSPQAKANPKNQYHTQAAGILLNSGQDLASLADRVVQQFEAAPDGVLPSGAPKQHIAPTMVPNRNPKAAFAAAILEEARRRGMAPRPR